jgi:hypothetical protein
LKFNCFALEWDNFVQIFRKSAFKSPYKCIYWPFNYVTTSR